MADCQSDFSATVSVPSRKCNIALDTSLQYDGTWNASDTLIQFVPDLPCFTCSLLVCKDSARVHQDAIACDRRRPEVI